ncbi:Uncharacterised protein [Vibrio cholerae]|nr:Uncharacterised protein [Vibrio cholerae]
MKLVQFRRKVVHIVAKVVHLRPNLAHKRAILVNNLRPVVNVRKLRMMLVRSPRPILSCGMTRCLPISTRCVTTCTSGHVTFSSLAKLAQPITLQVKR